MNILLLCSAGMSTSLLVQRMKEVAEDRNIEASVWSCGSQDSDHEIPKADVILVGPQLRFLLQKIEDKAKGIPVRVIDMMTYGRMDGSHALEIALTAWKERKNA